MNWKAGLYDPEKKEVRLAYNSGSDHFFIEC